MRAEDLLIWLVAFIPFAVAIVIPLFWCFVIWLLSFMSGWHELAQKYRAQQPATGKVWLSQYGFVNGGRYGNVLNITTNEAGLFLETMALFSINHPRLFIPWSDLHNPVETVLRNRPLIRVDVGYPTMASLSLPPGIFEEGEGRKVLEQSGIGTNVPT
jgi:hypothetical protein